MNDDESTQEVERGERYAKSLMTGNYYLVTAWVEKGGGKIQSREKEEVGTSQRRVSENVNRVRRLLQD
jgi:hypothetical protein